MPWYRVWAFSEDEGRCRGSSHGPVSWEGSLRIALALQKSVRWHLSLTLGFEPPLAGIWDVRNASRAVSGSGAVRAQKVGVTRGPRQHWPGVADVSVGEE